MQWHISQAVTLTNSLQCRAFKNTIQAAARVPTKLCRSELFGFLDVIRSKRIGMAVRTGQDINVLQVL